MVVRRYSVFLLVLATSLLSMLSWQTRAEDLIETIPRFYTNEFVLRPSNAVHEGHFQDSAQAGLTMVSLFSSIAIQSTNYPIGSSSAGLVYVEDDQGRKVRASKTFGPILSERALTLGKGNFNFGMTYQRTSYDEFNGLKLDGGDLNFVLQHVDADPVGSPGLLTPFWEGDIIQTNVDMTLTRDESVFFVNYGVTKRIDVGLVLPVVRVDLGASINGSIDRLATSAEGNTYHAFDAAVPPTGNCLPINDLNCSGSFDDSKTGIGDVVLRGKMNFMQAKKASLAGTIDARLPTGDEKNLLGSGSTEIEGQFVASWELGTVAPHVNVGYAASFGDYEVDTGTQVFTIEPSDEASASAGFSWAVASRVTVAGDLITRRFFDVASATVESTPFQFVTSSNPIAQTVMRDQIVPLVEDVDTTLGSVGVRIGLGRGILLNAAVLVPVSSGNGLEDDLSFLFALDFSR